MPSTHFKELDIQYDTNKLIEESKKVVWKPFKSKQQAGTFFDYAPTWLQGRVFGPHIDINDFPEIRKICNLIKFKIKTDDVRPRFYKQKANTHLPNHTDQDIKCAININLNQKSSPMIFEDNIECNYKCALLNLAKGHSVPKFNKERLVLKFSIFDIEYKEALKRWETPQQKSLWHLNYEIDKEYWKDIFYKNIQKGQWHHSVPKRKELFWYQLFIRDNSPLKKITKSLEMDLGIYGMNNFPRFSYQFPNTKLKHHLDEDNMVSINLNLLDTIPTIHIEHKPYPYEACFVDVGHKEHGVEKDPNHRLILKFCLRHPLEEVYKRLDNLGWIND